MVEESKKINHWIQHPSSMSWEDVLWLENLVRRFPFFQSAHTLIAKHYLTEDHILKSKKVNAAATHSLNRQKLRAMLLNNHQAPLSTEAQGNQNPAVQGDLSGIDSIKMVQSPIISEVEAPKDAIPDFSASNNTLQTEATEQESEQKAAHQTPSATSPEPTSGKSSETKENLLGAINKRLEELNELKKERTFQKIKERKEEKTTKPIIQPKEEPLLKESGTPAEPLPDPKTLNPDQNINPSEAQTLHLDAAKKSTEPKEIYESEYGDVLNGDEHNSLDDLLAYIQGQKAKKLDKKPDNKQVDHIVKRFIQEDPKMPKMVPGNEVKAIQKKVNKPKLISENLAVIYAQQGNDSAAIEIYEELSLKYPEKKAYFVSQINNIRKK